MKKMRLVQSEVGCGGEAEWLTSIKVVKNFLWATLYKMWLMNCKKCLDILTILCIKYNIVTLKNL